jgi:hypothetical protein
VLGTAFLLLETRSLVSFSLLFGSTWLVNALAFFAILASVLLAIFVNSRLRIRRAGLLYGLLFVALGVAFLLPPESLLIDPPWLRYLLAGVVAFAPVFLANLVFTYSFRDTRTADMAFASNLLGAMAGGALEYVALLSGYRGLLLIVAALYLLAWLFATRWRGRRRFARPTPTLPPSPGPGRRGGAGPSGRSAVQPRTTIGPAPGAPLNGRDPALAVIATDAAAARQREGSAIQRPLRTNRHVAALLSALWPGLGQLAIGERRIGWLLAIPPLLLLYAGIVALVSPDRVARLALLLNPEVIAALLIAEVALIAWRLAAVADAFRRGQGPAREALTAVALVFVLVPACTPGT